MKALIVLPILLTSMSYAQTAAFDAVSIKPNSASSTGAGGISSLRLTAGRAAMQNVSLKKVMLNAYGIPDDREYMIAGPEWLTSEHFDIDATFPADTPAAKVREMMQTMLAERFKLVLHKETRQLPMYSLVVAKDGPKIHAGSAGEDRTSGRPGHFEATGITMQKLADLIAKQAGRPVNDATGLQGVFDFTLEWDPQADLRVGTADAAGGGQGASIFTALQEQLGLRLEGGKGPVEVLVVDRMEKTPTEN
jgi:uncharacterized protein (TIGR03435 family)